MRTLRGVPNPGVPTLRIHSDPFVVSVCNIGGLSAGAFRILIFMNMLNYPVSKANSLIFIIITAAAMANFFTIVPRRHPRMNAPLVDYNLVYIMMPTLIFGTNLGVFLNKLLIELVQDILVSLVLIFFAVVYTRKFLEYRRNSKSRELLELISETNNEISADEEGKPDRTHTQSFERRQSRTPWLEMLLTLGVFVACRLCPRFPKALSSESSTVLLLTTSALRDCSLSCLGSSGEPTF